MNEYHMSVLYLVRHKLLFTFSKDWILAVVNKPQLADVKQPDGSQYGTTQTSKLGNTDQVKPRITAGTTPPS